MRNQTPDLRIPRSDATLLILLIHTDSTVSEVYYEIHMTRVLHDSVMILNRIREILIFSLVKV